jgi:hypothetical protein
MSMVGGSGLPSNGSVAADGELCAPRSEAMPAASLCLGHRFMSTEISLAPRGTFPKRPHIDPDSLGASRKGSFVQPRLGPRRLAQTDKLAVEGICTVRVFKIYVKSVPTGLAAPFGAVFLAGIVLIARVWMSSFMGRVDVARLLDLFS